ncbi:MAG: glutamate synthase subunit beta [Candidatus Ancillula sp.]|jgi:glutamate synthase (NADPH/NADH) small chain|nr:glutamate synthase subunit beta [Candidatus Ancillula sp.]
MADPRGFIKITERDIPGERSVNERLSDYCDVHEKIEGRPQIDKTEPQASRCMDCGVPFCHFSCPLGNIIPEFNDLVWNRKWREAYHRLSLTNNFPEFTGRLCPALCEQGCVLGSINPAVTIKNIELAISDIAFRREYVHPIPAEKVTGKTVAIIGSGPAGLTAAQQLTRAGHTVVVFEKDKKPGGLMRYGIPNFKMEKKIIDRRIYQIEAEGVRFRCGVKIGGNGKNDLSFEELRQRFDAVLIATGSSVPNDLKMEGRELNGIHFAMDFLPDATRAVLGEEIVNEDGAKREMLSAQGKNVLIIGGGDTGSDCLGTSLRQGAKMVTTLQVMPQPPKERDGEASDSARRFYGKQPWPTYPSLYTPSSSIEEGEETGKSSYLWETTATKFVGDEQGNDRAAVLANVEFKDGKFLPIEGTEREIPVDLVLISVGFKGPETETLFGGGKLGSDHALEVKMGPRAIARDDNFQTSLENVFVAGDAGRGQSLIVWAIAEGRSAAAAIDRHLEGETELPEPILVSTVALRK